MNHDLTVTIREAGTALGLCSCGATGRVPYDPAKQLAGWHALGRAERWWVEHLAEVEEEE